MELGRLAHFGIKYGPLADWMVRLSHELDARREDHLIELSCNKDNLNGEVVYRELAGLPLKLSMSEWTDNNGDKFISVGLDCDTGEKVHEFEVKMAVVLSLFKSRKGEYVPLFAFYHNMTKDAPMKNKKGNMSQAYLKPFIDANGIIRATARIYIHSTKGLRMMDTFDFSLPNADTDVTFVVGEKKLYANRKYLSMCSPVLRAMFEGQFTEGNSQEVIIRDTNAKAFADFLSSIYPSFCKPNDSNVEELLGLSDFYQVSFVTKTCEGYLLKSTTRSNAHLMSLADRYRLIGLQAKIWATLTTAIDIKRLMESRESSEFSVDLKLALFDLLVKKTPS